MGHSQHPEDPLAFARKVPPRAHRYTRMILQLFQVFMVVELDPHGRKPTLMRRGTASKLLIRARPQSGLHREVRKRQKLRIPWPVCLRRPLRRARLWPQRRGFVSRRPSPSPCDRRVKRRLDERVQRCSTTGVLLVPGVSGPPVGAPTQRRALSTL